MSLHEALLAHGGTLAQSSTAGAGADPSSPARQAAAGPRARRAPAEYELLVEMILEGSRLHYGKPRVVRPEDEDLALLLGDQLYALGLARLAELGDLDAVAELADVISLVAAAEAKEDAELADAAWEAGAAAVGWGTTPGHERAKEHARAGSGDGADQLMAEIAPEVRFDS